MSTSETPLEQIKEVTEQMLKLVNRISPKTWHSIKAALTWMEMTEKMAKIMDRTGWWPYRGMEDYLSGIDEESDIDQAAQRCEEFHDREWPKIRTDMVEHLSNCDVDAETKATFQECLTSHEAGMYRCVIRCVLVELERSLRIKVNKLDPTFSFVDDLEKIVNPLDMSVLFAGNPYGLELYSQISQRMFKSVRTEQERIEMRDTLNRHAALHGLIPYNTKKHSFNALVVSLYFLMLLSQIKETTCAAEE